MVFISFFFSSVFWNVDFKNLSNVHQQPPPKCLLPENVCRSEARCILYPIFLAWRNSHLYLSYGRQQRVTLSRYAAREKQIIYIFCSMLDCFLKWFGNLLVAVVTCQSSIRGILEGKKTAKERKIPMHIYQILNRQHDRQASSFLYSIAPLVQHHWSMSRGLDLLV